jgi:hypothetical protein
VIRRGMRLIVTFRPTGTRAINLGEHLR